MNAERALCPTCGQKLPNPRPKFSSNEARAAHVRAKIDAAKHRRHEKDLDVIAKLPDAFEVAQVGEELRRHGRHWSESAAVINRAIAYGAIVMLEPRYSTGGKTHRRFRKVKEASNG